MRKQHGIGLSVLAAGVLAFAPAAWADEAADAKSAGEAKQAFQQILKDIEAGHVDDAIAGMYIPKDDYQDAVEEMKEELPEVREAMKAGNFKAEVVEAKAKGDWALLVVVVTFKEEVDEGQTEQFSDIDRILLYKSDRWRVVEDQYVDDGALAKSYESDGEALEEWWDENMDALAEKHVPAKGGDDAGAAEDDDAMMME